MTIFGALFGAQLLGTNVNLELMLHVLAHTNQITITLPDLRPLTLEHCHAALGSVPCLQSWPAFHFSSEQQSSTKSLSLGPKGPKSSSVPSLAAAAGEGGRQMVHGWKLWRGWQRHLRVRGERGWGRVKIKSGVSGGPAGGGPAAALLGPDRGAAAACTWSVCTTGAFSAAHEPPGGTEVAAAVATAEQGPAVLALGRGGFQQAPTCRPQVVLCHGAVLHI